LLAQEVPRGLWVRNQLEHLRDPRHRLTRMRKRTLNERHVLKGNARRRRAELLRRRASLRRACIQKARRESSTVGCPMKEIRYLCEDGPTRFIVPKLVGTLPAFVSLDFLAYCTTGAA